MNTCLLIAVTQEVTVMLVKIVNIVNTAQKMEELVVFVDKCLIKLKLYESKN